MAKATIAELEAQIAELTTALNAAQTTPRGRVYLEGPVKFFRQAINRTTNELMNYYEFVVSEAAVERRTDGTTYRVDLPFDQCRISGNRPELVQQMQLLFQQNSFVVLRLHGAWKADGPIQLVNGYPKAQRKAFWVTRVEVLHTIAKGEPAYQRSEPVTVPAAAPVVQPIDSEVLSDEEVLALF